MVPTGTKCKSHFKFMKKEGMLNKKTNDRYQRQVRAIVESRYSKYFWGSEDRLELLSLELNKQISSRLSPLELVEIILKDEDY